LNWNITGFSSVGEYYFVIVAYNDATNTLSNCISVVVIEKETGASGGGGTDDDNQFEWIRVSTIFTIGCLLIVLIIIILGISLYLQYVSKKTDEYKQPKKAFKKNSKKPKIAYKKKAKRPKKAFKKLKH